MDEGKPVRAGEGDNDYAQQRHNQERDPLVQPVLEPVEAKLTVDEDGTTLLTGSASAANVKVQDENLSTHLLSPDFFDAERAPQITFSASDVAREGNDVTVHGELTIKGTTQPVTLTGGTTDSIEDAYGKERIGLTLETVVDRTNFGLNWNLPLPNGKSALANDVKLTAELYLVKEA